MGGDSSGKKEKLSFAWRVEENTGHGVLFSGTPAMAEKTAPALHFGSWHC
jgi:hypothetical protein